VLIATASLALVAVVLLGAVGIPAPPTITEQGVPRVPWRFALANLAVVRTLWSSAQFVAWIPGDGGMLVRARHRLMDVRLHRVSAPGAEPELLEALPRSATRVAYDPDGWYLVYAADSGGDERFRLFRWDLGEAAPVELPMGESRNVLGSFDRTGQWLSFLSTRRNGTDFDLYRIDPLRPESMELLFEGDGRWILGDWSPTADRLLAVRWTSADDQELYAFDVGTRVMTPLTDTAGPRVAFGAAVWAADGTGVWYTSDQDSEFKGLRHRDLESGEDRAVPLGLEWDIETLRRSPDGQRLVMAVNEDGVNRLYQFDAVSQSVRPLAGVPAGLLAVGAFRPHGPWLAIEQTDHEGRYRTHALNLDSGERTLWAGGREARSDLPAPELIRYPTFDSANGQPRTISAFWYDAAAGTSRPAPVVINIHGGPEAQAKLDFNPVFHLLRSRGITVITPNVRGSSGYGKTFLTLDNGMRREDAVRDIGALLDWIDGAPGLDAERVAVIGSSYGGFMVLSSLVTYPDRIRCGVDMYGISNFNSFMSDTTGFARDLRRAEYGDERDPATRAFFQSISPLERADRIRAPLFVFAGANDPRVPIGESRQIAERVRSNGIAVETVVASNEGHGIMDPRNAFWVGAASLAFLDRCLLR
jgi:dipeptidyl aminopeptidase/acylaminoacyl peptidase